MVWRQRQPEILEDIWLNEGFATYAQWLWLEHTSGRGALDQQANDWYENLKDNPVLPGDPGVRHLFDAAVYYRGALTLHALPGLSWAMNSFSRSCGNIMPASSTRT